MIEGSTCNCFRPTWKPTSRTMVAKVSQIASWVPMHSLPWAQCKRCISIRSMECVHTHRGMHVIERWGSLSHIWNVVQKIGENNWKVGKTNRVVNQAPVLGPKHDKIQAWWASNVSLESMLEKVWWWRHSEMESWSWTICCLMSCSNGGRHAWVRGGRRSHVALKCY